ncbi:barstar family protein [Bradyrhizobium sp. STM 3809]|uniref:barstar family protein n=1 Tax=Bradyrhizobium sp. STM 3809 TaxID=551936 RepID=UPI00024097FA|nr:barstar family protein [Bradyrhizobium sp. STM 3809]CCE01409.1 conserved hypothetical protein [Bradyrhizobium sp. STM 3809]
MTQATIVPIPSDRIHDWDSFHRVFQEALGFPGFYGCNMDAWIDCMTYVDDPDAGLSSITVAKGDLLILRVDNADELQRRCPEQYQALLECTAFVNHRRDKPGQSPVLALMLSGYF